MRRLSRGYGRLELLMVGRTLALGSFPRILFRIRVWMRSMRCGLRRGVLLLLIMALRPIIPMITSCTVRAGFVGRVT